MICIQSTLVGATSGKGLGQVSAIATQKDATAPSETVATAIAWQPMSDLVSGFTYGNGLTFLATRDLDYRLDILRVQNAGSNVIHRNHNFGDGMNLTALIDGVSASNTVTMSYSPTNRLASATGPWGTASYSFDATGIRILEQTGANARTFAYPANSNRIASESLNAVPVRSFAHDGAGNLTAGVPQGASYTLTYNQRNRPGSLRLNGTEVAAYLYNAQEQLARRVAMAPLKPGGPYPLHPRSCRPPDRRGHRSHLGKLRNRARIYLARGNAGHGDGRCQHGDTLSTGASSRQQDGT